jgi:predicted phage-related endonuclease
MRQNVIAKITQEQVQMVEDWRLLDAQIKKLTADRDAIRDGLKLHMEGHDVGQFRNATLLQWHETRRNLLDGKRLRTERPEIADEYTKESVSRQLTYVS